MIGADQDETAFWPLFSSVIGRPIAPGRYTTDDLPEWDSLRHIELVFALEETYGVTVPRDQIAGLYSDTDAVLSFLRQQAGGG